MNAENVELSTSPVPTNSNDSSKALPSPTTLTSPSPEKNTMNSNVSPQEDFETAPLRGLLKKPMDEMSLEELRARVVEIRRLRKVPMAFRQKIEEETREKETVKTKRQDVALKGLDDLV